MQRIPRSYQGGLLRLDEEFPRPSDPEAIIRGLHGAADPDGILMDHILVSLSVAGRIVYIPTEDLKSWVSL